MFNQYYTFKLLPWLAMVCDLLVLLGFGGGMIVPAIYAMAGAVWPNGENDIQCNILSSKHWCSNRRKEWVVSLLS